jgi:hypothetical protein
VFAKKFTMNNLTKLNKTIDHSIEKVKNIPIIKTSNFDTTQLKEEVIPLLQEAKSRLKDIAHINSNITGIRNEIIKPVVNVIEARSKQNKWFTNLGIAFGIVGIVLTITSSLISKDINLSSSSLNEIKNHDTDLLRQFTSMDTVEGSKVYDNEILIFYRRSEDKTEEAKHGAESLRDYLKGLGYTNVSFNDSPIGGNLESGTTIYYKRKIITNNILLGMENHCLENDQGKITCVRYDKVNNTLINEVFSENDDLALVIEI